MPLPLAALLAALGAAPGAGALATSPAPAGHSAALSALEAAGAAREGGRRGEERAQLERAVAADPGWDLPRLDLAELRLREEGDARAALELLAAPGLRRDNPRLPRLRGAALEQIGDEAGAAQAYGEALELRDDAELRLHRAVLLARVGAADEAIAELERVRAARPGAALCRSQLADLYEGSGRRAEAEAELRWLVAAAPGDPASLRRLAAFLSRGGDPEEAARLDGRARALERPARVLRPLAPDGRR